MSEEVREAAIEALSDTLTLKSSVKFGKGDPMTNGHDLDPGTGEGVCGNTGESIEAETMGDLTEDCPHCGLPLSVLTEKEDGIGTNLASRVSKEWTGPHQGDRGGTYWQNTETGERRYQEDKPVPGEGEEGGDGDETQPDAEEEESESSLAPDLGEDPGDDDPDDVQFIEAEEGEFRVEEVEYTGNLEEGEEVILDADGEKYDVAEVGVDATGQYKVVLETGGDFPTVVDADDLAGRVLGEALDTGEYDPETEFGRELAHGVVSGEMGESGTDGFVGVRDIQHHASDIEDSDLLADALVEELEERNSASATGALESRLRAIGEDPEELLDERGYGKTEGPDGGETGDFPGEYDSAEEWLSESKPGHPQNDETVWSQEGFAGTLGKGLNNADEWQAVAEQASTDELEEFLIEEYGAYRTDDGDLQLGAMADYWNSQQGNMVLGLLYYREDSNVGLDSAVPFREGVNYEELDINVGEVQNAAEDFFDQIDPVYGAAAATSTAGIEAGQPENKDWNGVYHSTGGKIEVASIGSPSEAGSPNTVSHELAHSLHYMMGIGGGGKWGDNSWGNPKDKNVDTPLDRLENATGKDYEEISDEDLRDAGWQPEAFEMAKDVEQEWKRYRSAQLEEYQYDEGISVHTTNELNRDDLYVVESPNSDEVHLAEFDETHAGNVKFDVVDNEKAFDHTLRIDEDDLAFNVNEAINVEEPSDEIKQLRSYQAKGLHEFFTVNMSHYTNDRKKLEDHHSEMADVYDNYFGRGGWEELDTRAVVSDVNDAEDFREETGVGPGDTLRWEESDGYTQYFEVDEIERVGGGGRVYIRGDDDRIHMLSYAEADTFEVLD